MSLQKLRDLSKYGVITDVDPFDLPLGAWSMAINARFQDGSISSAPVWRAIGALNTPDPRFLFVANKAANASRTYVGYLGGSVSAWSPAVEIDVSPDAYTPAESDAVWSGCTLADVVYINREDREPWALLPDSDKFIKLPAWPTDTRVKIMRAYNSALHAFNVTVEGKRYPTMVLSSDIVTDPGVHPLTWDYADPTTNAVSNILTEMNGEIIDAVPFGAALLLYSSSEAWEMRADGSANIYGYQRLPFSSGIINANCVVTIANKQYGFGPEDIWVHDGVQQISICSGSVRKHIFSSLNAKKSARFFTSHDAGMKTLTFHYVSGDSYVYFNGGGCNRAAVYNYENSTWTFDDLPLVYAARYAVVSLGTELWSTVDQAWHVAGGTWQDLEDGSKRSTIYAGEASAEFGLSTVMYARDVYGKGSSVPTAVDTAATRGMVLHRDGMDLDELGIELRGYKLIRTIYPQGRLDATAEPVTFTFGVTDYADEIPTYSIPQTWNARDLYWCDFNATGRFLSLHVEYPDFKTMNLSGIDVDIELTGDR